MVISLLTDDMSRRTEGAFSAEGFQKSHGSVEFEKNDHISGVQGGLLSLESSPLLNAFKRKLNICAV